MIKSKLSKLAPFLQSAMVVFVASLFVMSIVYAATTIGTNISTEGNATIPMLNATTTNVGTLTVYTGSTLTGLATASDLRPAMLNATTTNVGTLKVYTGSTLTGLATASDLRPAMLNATTTNAGTLTVYTSGVFRGGLNMYGAGIDLTTSTATTSVAIYSRNRTTSTSTVSIGDQNQNVKGCLEMVREGAYYSCYITAAGTGIECAAGRCN